MEETILYLLWREWVSQKEDLGFVGKVEVRQAEKMRKDILGRGNRVNKDMR